MTDVHDVTEGSGDMTSTEPQAIWSGSFIVFGVEVKCHTLDDGRRIIEAESLAELFEAMANGDADVGDLSGFHEWQRQAPVQY